MVQTPEDTIVRLAPETVHTPVVLDENDTVRSDEEDATSGSGEAVKVCVPGLAKVIDWLAFATVSVKDWPEEVPAELVALKVSGQSPTVPDAGVPASAPEVVLKVTPEGSVPERMKVGVGVPVAVAEKPPAENTVKVVALPLVMVGITGVGTGVTPTVPEAALAPATLFAFTEQE